MIELEERAAALLGQEEAVYLPTATMANQIALEILTASPGGRLIVEEHSHILVAELGGAAVHSRAADAAAAGVRRAARAGADRARR